MASRHKDGCPRLPEDVVEAVNPDGSHFANCRRCGSNWRLRAPREALAGADEGAGRWVLLCGCGAEVRSRSPKARLPLCSRCRDRWLARTRTKPRPEAEVTNWAAI